MVVWLLKTFSIGGSGFNQQTSLENPRLSRCTVFPIETHGIFQLPRHVSFPGFSGISRIFWEAMGAHLEKNDGNISSTLRPSRSS